MNEGMGTHIDAPAHCIAEGRTITDLDVNELIAPCVVIDISKQARETYVVSLLDVTNFEDASGS